MDKKCIGDAKSLDGAGIHLMAWLVCLAMLVAILVLCLRLQAGEGCFTWRAAASFRSVLIAHAPLGLQARMFRHHLARSFLAFRDRVCAGFCLEKNSGGGLKRLLVVDRK